MHIPINCKQVLCLQLCRSVKTLLTTNASCVASNIGKQLSQSAAVYCTAGGQYQTSWRTVRRIEIMDVDRTNGWTGGRKDEQTGERKYGRTEWRTNERTDGPSDRRTGRTTDGGRTRCVTDGRSEWRMDGVNDEWTEWMTDGRSESRIEQTNEHTCGRKDWRTDGQPDGRADRRQKRRTDWHGLCRQVWLSYRLKVWRSGRRRRQPGESDDSKTHICVVTAVRQTREYFLFLG